MDTVAQLNSALSTRYQIERELGRGGMATVYLARDVRHDRQVALKVLHPDLTAALGAERFLAEIRTTATSPARRTVQSLPAALASVRPSFRRTASGSRTTPTNRATSRRTCGRPTARATTAGKCRRAAETGRDGRELFYVSRDSLMSAQVASNPDFTVKSRRALFSMSPFGDHFDLFPNGELLMLERRWLADSRMKIVFVRDWRDLLHSTDR